MVTHSYKITDEKSYEQQNNNLSFHRTKRLETYTELNTSMCSQSKAIGPRFTRLLAIPLTKSDDDESSTKTRL